MLRLAYKVNERETMGRCAREVVEEKFNWNNTANAMLELYKKITVSEGDIDNALVFESITSADGGR
jgi:glycosyltransferase involved in cell wall biosynthesis